MNFINAILHVNIGYGIRRMSWQEGAILHLGGGQKLFWLGKEREPVTLLGDDETHDLNAEDLKATDWETV